MKKYLIFIAVLAALLFPTLADASSVAVDPVSDYADMLTDAEESELARRLEYIRNTYAADTAIVTVPTLDGKSAEAYADDFYDYNGYGIGPDDSGILLLISREPRNYHMTTMGRCFDIFNDAAIDYMCSNVEAQLRNDNYYEACMRFAEDCESVLSDYENGERFEEPKSVGMLFIMLGIALVLAITITAAAKSSMKNARLGVNADLYAEGRKVNLIGSRDVFLYSDVTKTPIPKQQSGGGSTGHISSSGRMHGGGGGSY